MTKIELYYNKIKDYLQMVQDGEWQPYIKNINYKKSI